ncbi:MAG TPA: imidazole glycerol phosphate synthase cyclase subunit [Elusimicrobiota bacterium]|nr:imidazole glycerol phosphate synthase cyclase subunit [Elusimicrobiota bacterium]
MRRTLRIIPRLDIKGPNLVKGIHLEGLRVLGKPWDFAHTYYREGADELIYIDAVASLYGRNNLLEIVKKTAENVFIPLTVGGGVRSLEDMRNLLCAGADKIAINTAAVHQPDLITQGAKMFGSQCIVGSIQAKLIDGRYYAYTDNAREFTELDVFDWARRLVDLGAGEILVTSIDQEGTAKGYELNLVRRLSETLTVPLIVCGGCGRPEHVADVAGLPGVDAVCASSIFHYNYLSSVATRENYEAEGNIEFLKKNRGGTPFMSTQLAVSSIGRVKEFLCSRGIPCRWPLS